MTDDDPRLDALDRRAATAVAELDRALPTDTDWVPTPDIDRRSPRRVTPLLLVAAVVVVAILGLGLAVSRFDDGDDQSTIAGEVEADDTVPPGEFTRLVIPDPDARGLELTAAYDRIDEAAAPSGTATAQGPIDAADPWTDAVLVGAGPDSLVEYGLVGEVVDLAGTEATLLRGPFTSVQWIDDGRLLTISTATLSVDDLVALATAAVGRGWDGTGPLPGHRVLRELRDTDTHPVQSYLSMTDPVAVAAVGYRSDAIAFTVGTSPGGEDLFEATQLVGTAEPIAVRGHEGVVIRHEGAGNLAEIVWRENTETVVRVETYDEPSSIVDVLDALTPIDSAAFDALVGANPVSDEQRLLAIPDEEFDRFGDPESNPPDEVLAELVSTRNGLDAEALLLRYGDEFPEFRFMVDDTSGGASGSGGMVYDLDHPVLQRGQDGSRTVYAGVVPGVIKNVDVTSGGGVTVVSDVEQTPVSGAEANLFIAWSPVDVSGSSTIVRITLTDGRVIRYAV